MAQPTNTKSTPRFGSPRFLAVLWTLGILLACSLPASSIPDTSGTAYDKVVHLLMFLGFGALWMYTWGRSIRSRTAWVLVIGMVFACLTEVYQGLLPFDRTPDPLDALADTVGLLLGVACYFGQRWLR